ncbi:MAG TPA: hypothetical protein VGO70_11120 [Arsenicitalea sp.]|nr:hypothetical protein [Arsenicitalea sp.]
MSNLDCEYTPSSPVVWILLFPHETEFVEIHGSSEQVQIDLKVHSPFNAVIFSAALPVETS